MTRKKYSAFGRIFRTALKSKGWTLNKFSKESGIKLATVGNYSRGANIPEGENREKVVRLLGLRDSQLLPDNGETSNAREISKSEVELDFPPVVRNWMEGCTPVAEGPRRGGEDSEPPDALAEELFAPFVRVLSSGLPRISRQDCTATRPSVNDDAL
jgi:transcriptional regulator with XRE-family HTH domain